MWEGVGDRTELQHIDPHSYGHQCCVFLVLLMLNRWPEGSAFCWVLFSPPHLASNPSDLQQTWGSEGPFGRVVAFSTTPFLRLLWSSTHRLPVFNELYNSSIAHSISILMASQAGICHFQRLWTGMFDHHQSEITVMQFRGHSLPVHQSVSVPWDLTLSHFVSQARLRDFFS